MSEFRKDMLDELVKMMEEHNSWKAFEHNFNFRTSISKNQMIEDELEELHKLGLKISKNDLINLCIDLVLGYVQSEKQSNYHYRSRNVMTIKNYMSKHKAELKQRRRDRLEKMDEELSELELRKKSELKKRRRHQEKIDRELNFLNDRDSE